MERDLSESIMREEKQKESKNRRRFKLDLKVGGLRKTANGIKRMVEAAGSLFKVSY